MDLEDRRRSLLILGEGWGAVHDSIRSLYAAMFIQLLAELHLEYTLPFLLNGIYIYGHPELAPLRAILDKILYG
jgi:hypothetical protein